MNTPITITCKKQFHRLWHDGMFGNKARDWKNIRELKRSGFQGTVAIRYCGTSSGSLFIKDLSVRDAEREMHELCRQGWHESDLYILEQLSPDRVRYLINGEAIRTDSNGLALFYSRENMLMRDALRRSGRQVFGIVSDTILRTILTPTDYDELVDLLDRFPDHAIEFSGFDRSVGLMPRHRMIIWEVRMY